MPNAALNAYLAKNYLDGAKAEAYLARGDEGDAERKKKKRKKLKQEDGGRSSGSGFKLIDDNDDSWKKDNDGDVELENTSIVQQGEGSSSGGSRWSKVGKGSEDPRGAQKATFEKEERDAKEADDDVRDPASSTPSTSTQAVRAGLKSREQMRAERLEREERLARDSARSATVNDVEQDRKSRLEREREEAQQQTIYRDASGRRVDVEKEEEEGRHRERERRRLEREKEDWNKGDVQRRQARERARREEEERTSTFARHANDERMNATLRNVERADDPAARFLSRKQSDDSSSRKPTYKGNYPPNRFNIRPGYRWDGVERSNGFEAKLFQRKNERSRRKTEMQAWGQEDM